MNVKTALQCQILLCSTSFDKVKLSNGGMRTYFRKVISITVMLGSPFLPFCGGGCVSRSQREGLPIINYKDLFNFVRPLLEVVL